ncbi:MAG TPA: DNA polymerase Y family protein [Stellaceae bacterium]|nr:DNA polymerase Y family protein [Stellaceae bacterium]
MLYLFLPRWPIDRLRRAGLLPNGNLSVGPGDLPRKPAAPSTVPPRRRPGPASAEAAAPTCPPEPPFATVIAANGRQVLAAVNPEAETLGLRPGLPLADALSFVPGLATRPAQPGEDDDALRRLAEWCGRYSPWTAPDHRSGGGVKVEITGSAHLWGGEAALAADLARRLARQGIAHRLAVADTLGAAWALARFAADERAPAIVAPGETRAALMPLPVAALRLDPVLVEGLHRAGLRRVGEVLAMPRDALARRFGADLARRLDQALDAVPEPLSPLGETPARRVRLSFAEPIADPADLARAIERLTLDLVSRLAREGMGARRLDLGFHRVDGRVEHVRLGTARPSRDSAHLAKLLIGKLDTIDPGLGIEDVILAAFAVERLEAEQIGMAGSPDATASDTAPLFDRLGARLGLDALARIEPRASHIPERAAVAAPITNKDSNKSPSLPSPPGGIGGSAKNKRGGRPLIADQPNSPSNPAGQASRAGPLPSPLTGGEAPIPAKPPRPVRLFAPPEPIDAFWVMPDDPPFHFTWRRRRHRIAQADGPERIAEEWWQPNGWLDAGYAGAIRDYYRVEDEAGRRFWLFRAGLPGDPPPRWFVHGVFA